MLFFACLLLPSFEGCNGKTRYVVQAVRVEIEAPELLFLDFLLLWPFVFGLVVCIFTIWLVLSPNRNVACGYWCTLSVLFVALHAHLLTMVFVISVFDGATFGRRDIDWPEGFSIVAVYLLITILVSIYTLITLKARSWFGSAMLMQTGLAVLAALTLWTAVPFFFLASRVLVGWKLATTCALALVINGLVLRFDGERLLRRRRSESPLRLSLRQSLLVMLVGGLACAWSMAAWSADRWFVFTNDLPQAVADDAFTAADE